MRIITQVMTALVLALIVTEPCIYSDCSEDSPDCQAVQGRLSLPLNHSHTSELQRLSQVFGHLLGRDLQAQDVDLDTEAVISGLRAELAGQPSPMTESEYAEAMQWHKDSDLKEIAGHNLALADAFMASNSKKSGVMSVVPSKVQYRVILQGTGPVVKSASAPLMQFTGRYLDGTLFGSTDEAGGPIAIKLSEMIPGFRQAVVGMREGEKRRLFIHPDFAYGQRSSIPPNSLLIFDVEVVSRAEATAEPQTKVHQMPIGVKRDPVPQERSWNLSVDDEDDVFSNQPLKLRPAN